MRSRPHSFSLQRRSCHQFGQDGLALQIIKEAFGVSRMWRASNDGGRIWNVERFRAHWQGRDWQPLTLRCRYVVEISQPHNRLTTSHQSYDHRITVDEKWFVGRQRAAPTFPWDCAPTLAQG